jgi:hypothetical protein
MSAWFSQRCPSSHSVVSQGSSGPAPPALLPVLVMAMFTELPVPPTLTEAGLVVDDPMYVFMDTEFNQFDVEKDNLGDALNYLEEGLSCELTFYEGRAISVELPNSVDREVTYTEPAVKGDTSGKVMKPAKLANGFEVQVPLFVTTGDKIEIDTRTGEYKRRV